MTGQMATDTQPQQSKGYLLGAVDSAKGAAGTLLENVSWSSPGSAGTAATPSQQRGDASSGVRSVSDPGAALGEANVSRAGLDTDTQEEAASAANTVTDNAKAVLQGAHQKATEATRAVLDSAQRTFDQSDDTDRAPDEPKGLIQGAFDNVKGVAESVVDNVKWAVGVTEKKVDDGTQAVKINMTSQNEDDAVGGAFAGSEYRNYSTGFDTQPTQRPQDSMNGDKVAADASGLVASESSPQQGPQGVAPADRGLYGDQVMADGFRLAESDQQRNQDMVAQEQRTAIASSNAAAQVSHGDQTAPDVSRAAASDGAAEEAHGYVQGALESFKVAAGTIVDNVKWAVGAGGGNQPESAALDTLSSDAPAEDKHREFPLSDVPEHGFHPAQSGADDGKVVASSAVAASDPILGEVSQASHVAVGASQYGSQSRSKHGPVLELQKLSSAGATHDKVVASSGDGTVAEKVKPVVAATDQEVHDAAAAAQQALASGRTADQQDKHGVVQTAVDGVKVVASHVVDNVKWAVGAGEAKGDAATGTGQVSGLRSDRSEGDGRDDVAEPNKGYVQSTVDQARAATIAVVETVKSAVGVDDKKRDDRVRLAQEHEVFATPRGTGGASGTEDHSKGLVQGAVDSIKGAAASVVESVKWAVGASEGEAAHAHSDEGGDATVRASTADVRQQPALTAQDTHQANYLGVVRVKVEEVRKVAAEKATWAVSQDNPLGKAVQPTADIARQAIITSAASAILGPSQGDSKQQPAAQHDQNSTVQTGEQKEEKQKKKGFVGKTADKFRGAGKGCVALMRKAGLAAKKEKNHVVEAIDDAKHKGQNQG